MRSITACFAVHWRLFAIAVIVLASLAAIASSAKSDSNDDLSAAIAAAEQASCGKKYPKVDLKRSCGYVQVVRPCSNEERSRAKSRTSIKVCYVKHLRCRRYFLLAKRRYKIRWIARRKSKDKKNKTLVFGISKSGWYKYIFAIWRNKAFARRRRCKRIGTSRRRCSFGKWRAVFLADDKLVLARNSKAAFRCSATYDTVQDLRTKCRGNKCKASFSIGDLIWRVRRALKNRSNEYAVKGKGKSDKLKFNLKFFLTIDKKTRLVKLSGGRLYASDGSTGILGKKVAEKKRRRTKDSKRRNKKQRRRRDRRHKKARRRHNRRQKHERRDYRKKRQQRQKNHKRRNSREGHKYSRRRREDKDAGAERFTELPDRKHKKEANRERPEAVIDGRSRDTKAEDGRPDEGTGRGTQGRDGDSNREHSAKRRRRRGSQGWDADSNRGDPPKGGKGRGTQGWDADSNRGDPPIGGKGRGTQGWDADSNRGDSPKGGTGRGTQGWDADTNRESSLKGRKGRGTQGWDADSNREPSPKRDIGRGTQGWDADTNRRDPENRDMGQGTQGRGDYKYSRPLPDGRSKADEQFNKVEPERQSQEQSSDKVFVWGTKQGPRGEEDKQAGSEQGGDQSRTGNPDGPASQYGGATDDLMDRQRLRKEMQWRNVVMTRGRLTLEDKE